VLTARHVPQPFDGDGQIHNWPDFGRPGWTLAVQGSILIYYPANAEFGAVALITKCLRNFGRKMGLVSIYYPANAESGVGRLILNALQLWDLPKRRFQYNFRQPQEFDRRITPDALTLDDFFFRERELFNIDHESAA